MRVSRQWWCLESLRQFGFANDNGRIPGPGDLALFCAACSQPGVNLPEGWQDQPNQLACSFIPSSLILTLAQVEIQALISYGWKHED
jgi:hypothetical protein